MSVVVILLLTLLYSIHQSSLHPDYVELGFYFLLNRSTNLSLSFTLSLSLSPISPHSHSIQHYPLMIFFLIFLWMVFLFLQHLSSFFRRYRLICYRCWWQITFAFTPVLQIEVNTARWLQEARINVLPLST